MFSYRKLLDSDLASISSFCLPFNLVPTSILSPPSIAMAFVKAISKILWSFFVLICPLSNICHIRFSLLIESLSFAAFHDATFALIVLSFSISPLNVRTPRVMPFPFSTYMLFLVDPILFHRFKFCLRADNIRNLYLSPVLSLKPRLLYLTAYISKWMSNKSISN